MARSGICAVDFLLNLLFALLMALSLFAEKENIAFRLIRQKKSPNLRDSGFGEIIF